MGSDDYMARTAEKMYVARLEAECVALKAEVAALKKEPEWTPHTDPMDRAVDCVNALDGLNPGALVEFLAAYRQWYAVAGTEWGVVEWPGDYDAFMVRIHESAEARDAAFAKLEGD